jgi:hypothetical protein
MVYWWQSIKEPSMTDDIEYRIQVQGWIGKRWAHWLDDVTVSYARSKDGSPITVLCAQVVDQAALRGLLSKLWDLNLTLISVTCLSAGPIETGERKGKEG